MFLLYRSPESMSLINCKNIASAKSDHILSSSWEICDAPVYFISCSTSLIAQTNYMTGEIYWKKGLFQLQLELMQSIEDGKTQQYMPGVAFILHPQSKGTQWTRSGAVLSNQHQPTLTSSSGALPPQGSTNFHNSSSNSDHIFRHLGP